jgi:hypothetical protein
LKALGGPDGPQTLTSEVVATQLAEWFRLSTLDWGIVVLDELPFVDKEDNQIGRACPEPAFITRAEKGIEV